MDVLLSSAAGPNSLGIGSIYLDGYAHEGGLSTRRLRKVPISLNSFIYKVLSLKDSKHSTKKRLLAISYPNGDR